MAQVEMKSVASEEMQSFEGYGTHAITSKFLVELQPSTSYSFLPDSKKNLIQTIWDQEQKKRDGKLHEGAILSAVSYDSTSLVGQFVPYKFFLAQMCDPSLKPDLKIVPVSICGMTLIHEDVIIAKRAPWVSQFPNCYELAPSGGVRPPGRDFNAVDLKAQLLDELEEEIGMGPAHVKSVKFFSLVHDEKADAIELCAEIRLKPSRLILSSTSEYSQVIAVPCQELESFVRDHREDFVPLSLILLKLKKLIS